MSTVMSDKASAKNLRKSMEPDKKVSRGIKKPIHAASAKSAKPFQKQQVNAAGTIKEKPARINLPAFRCVTNFFLFDGERCTHDAVIGVHHEEIFSILQLIS